MSILPTSHYSYGCTDFQIKTENNEVFCCRSMDFPRQMESKLHVYPRGVVHASTAPDGSKGLEWTAKYGFIGITAFHLSSPDEGMNEVGLSFGFLTLLSSEYQEVLDSEKKHALAVMDVGTWILSNFATVDEVKEAIKKVKIWGDFVPALKEVPKLHIALHDATGKNLVIEFIKGAVEIHENPLGVLTNDPPFDWHVHNIGQYNALTNETPASIEINGTIISASGIGSGMKGLPGDWSSISRFVRIAKAIQFALPPKNSDEAIVSCFHLLNTVNTPKGVVAVKIENSTLYETTRWTVVKDLTHRILYFQSYGDPTIRSICLKEISFEPDSKHRPIKVESETPTIFDITKNLRA